MTKAFVCWAVCSVSINAAIYVADSISVNIATASEAAFGGNANKLVAKISEKYQIASLDSVTKGATTAQSLATVGAGQTYAQGPYTFMVGLGGGVAANGVNQSLGQIVNKFSDLSGDALPQFGIGAQLSGVVGMNLAYLRTPRFVGPLELSRMSVLTNFFALNSSSLAAGLDTTATVFGLHLQYQLRRAQGRSWLRGGDITVTTGFDYSRLALRYDSTIGAKALTPIAVGAGTSADPLLTFTPNGTIALSSGAGTVPIELSTSVRLFYLLSIFIGGSADFNVGKAATQINISGAVNGSNGASANIGTATVVVDKTARPDLLTARGFAGIQLNLIPGTTTNILSLFTQAALSSAGGFAIQLGVRGAW